MTATKRATDKNLMERRDMIADAMREAGARCFGTVDMRKESGGATLFMECWCKGPAVALLIVDKFGGVCTYRPLNTENDMPKEIEAIKQHFA